MDGNDEQPSGSCSTPDGWWIAGFALEPAEDDVVPLFFERDPDGMPRRRLTRCVTARAATPSRAAVALANTERAVREEIRDSLQRIEHSFAGR